MAIGITRCTNWGTNWVTQVEALQVISEKPRFLKMAICICGLGTPVLENVILIVLKEAKSQIWG